MSTFEYLRTHPKQLERLIQNIRGSSLVYKYSFTKEPPHASQPTPSMNCLPSTPSTSKKVDSFYISLFINGYKLNNCIIDSGASDNVMPTKFAKSLDLSLSPTSGKFLSMEMKQVPLVRQVKDTKVTLIDFPDKKITMRILVVDMLA